MYRLKYRISTNRYQFATEENMELNGVENVDNPTKRTRLTWSPTYPLHKMHRPDTNDLQRCSFKDPIQQPIL